MAIRERHQTKNDFPIPGNPKILYVDESDGKRYWWDGIRYKEGLYFRIYDTANAQYVDIAELIEANGIKYTRNDVDAAKAGRTLSGYMYRGRVTMKVKLEIKCKALNAAQTKLLMRLIFPEYVTVQYIDPREGERTAQFYSNNVPATTCTEVEGGDVMWNDISFPLIER